MPSLINLYKTRNSRKRLLRDFLGYEKPSSPLYGKGIYEVIVERSSRDESLEFFRKGFREEGIDPPEDVVERAVELFDGIVGWLVLFGRKYADGYRDVSSIMDMAVELVIEELSKLSIREKIVLEAVARDCRSWSQVRRFIADKYGVVIPKSSLTRIINKLEKLSIIKNYEFLDPVYREAAMRLKARLKVK